MHRAVPVAADPDPLHQGIEVGHIVGRQRHPSLMAASDVLGTGDGSPRPPPRRGRTIGVSHDVVIPGRELFNAGIHLHGGPAPVRQYLPRLIDLIWRREIDPGKVFDLVLPLDRAAEVYQAMDQRRAVKVLLTV